MRLKLLLSVMLVGCVPAMAASQLTAVNVATAGNVTTLTATVSGAFTHNEYRPTDNLLLVDLAGVAPARLAGSAHDVNAPGVATYRVLDYKGVNGADVTRLEISVPAGTQASIANLEGGIAVRLTSMATPASATPATAKTVTSTAAPASTAAIVAKPAAPAPAMPSRRATVQTVGVVRGSQGVEVEIVGDSALTHKALQLSGPDRVVIDVLNAVPAGHQKEIAVNAGDIRAVRVGRFQQQPPITRVVIDMNAPHAYDIVAAGHKLTFRMAAVPQRTATPASPAASPKQEVTVVAAAEAPAAIQLAASSNNNAAAPVLSHTNLRSLPRVSDTTYRERVSGPAPVRAMSRSERAAASFSNPSVEIPVNNLAQFAPAAMRQQAGAPPMQSSPSQGPAPGMQMQPAMASAPQPCLRDRYNGEPISVNLKDVDLKDFFRLVHEISGLNVVLDPNVRGTLTLVLDDVPWDQALGIVLQNNGLDCTIAGNVIRVATLDTLRKEAEAAHARDLAQAAAVPKVNYTHYLSYAHAKEVSPTIKKFLSDRGDVIADDRTNSLIINDIPAVIPEVQRILVQLDKKSDEVEIEARVIAATRNFARDIGTQFGFGWGNGTTTAVGGAAAVGTSPNIVSGAAPAFFTIGNSIPLFSNMPAVGPTSGLSITNATNNYRLDFILTMAESRGLLKILSRPRVTTQNNILAVVRQGVKVPVVTAAQLGGPPTVSYFEAFLRLSVTPQITAEHTIFMNLDLENTTPDFGRQVNGNPTMVTQQAQTSVLVNDGGTVMIGGVIQTQNSVNQTQVPLLGNIPVLGNLFKRRTVSTSTQELIFFITPKIIQG
jgi:type IV pilus assembly protein PilQ